MIKETDYCVGIERHLKQAFGKDVDLENIARRTCIVSFQRDPEREEFEIVVSKIKAFRAVVANNAFRFRAYLELENGFKIDLFMNQVSSVNVRAMQKDLGDILDLSEYVQACAYEQAGWALCVIKEGVRFKKERVKTFFKILPRIKVPCSYNAKLKIL